MRLLDIKVRNKIKKQLKEELSINIKSGSLINHEWLSTYFLDYNNKKYLIINKKSMYENKICDSAQYHVDRNIKIEQMLNKYKTDLTNFITISDHENYVAERTHNIDGYFEKFYKYIDNHISQFLKVFHNSETMVIFELPFNIKKCTNKILITSKINQMNKYFKDNYLGISFFYMNDFFYQDELNNVYYLNFESFSVLPLLYFNAFDFIAEEGDVKIYNYHEPLNNTMVAIKNLDYDFFELLIRNNTQRLENETLRTVYPVGFLKNSKSTLVAQIFAGL